MDKIIYMLNANKEGQCKFYSAIPDMENQRHTTGNQIKNIFVKFVAMLLYGCKTWNVNAVVIRRLHIFLNR